MLAGAAAYTQTLTGFAFGLITMGGIGLTGLMSLPDAAVLVSVLTLVNAAQMLLKGWRDIAWREFGSSWYEHSAALCRLWLLEWLAEPGPMSALILGIVIIVSSLQLARKPDPLRSNRRRSFLFFGGIAGLMGGLFSTAGPPLVYHFYRQPMPLVTLRETLVTVFALNAVFRIGLVAVSGNLPSARCPGLFAIPSSWRRPMRRAAGRRLSPKTMRRIVFILLFLSGVSLGSACRRSPFGKHKMTVAVQKARGALCSGIEGASSC